MTAGRNSRCNFLHGLAAIVNKLLIWREVESTDVRREMRGLRGERRRTGICRPSAAKSDRMKRYAIILPPTRQEAVSEHVHYSTRRSGTGWG
jgi:hypothetical protein